MTAALQQKELLPLFLLDSAIHGDRKKDKQRAENALLKLKADKADAQAAWHAQDCPMSLEVNQMVQKETWRTPNAYSAAHALTAARKGQ